MGIEDSMCLGAAHAVEASRAAVAAEVGRLHWTEGPQASPEVGDWRTFFPILSKR